MAKRLSMPKPTMPKTPALAPFPHRNLGPHLKKPTSGEYVTEHHRGAKKR